MVHPRWSLIILLQFWEIKFWVICRLSRISCAHEIDDCRINSGARSCLMYRINFLISHRDGLRSDLGPGSINTDEILNNIDVLLRVAFWPLVAPLPPSPEEGALPRLKKLSQHDMEPKRPERGGLVGSRKPKNRQEAARMIIF